MKKTYFIILMLFGFSVIGFTQIKEGKISYERKINMHRSLPDPQMKSMVPEFRTDKFELLFNESASLFRSVVEEEAPDPFANAGGGGGGGMRMSFRMPSTTTYTDIAKQTQYEARAFFEKEFLIIDSLKQYKWKLSDETKTIAKQLCKKATTMVSAPQQIRVRMNMGGNNADTSSNTPMKPKETELVVWYAENITVSVGPDNYSGLPGVIMEMDLDNGGTVTTAVEVSTKYPKKELIPPIKGEKMNRVQFQDNMQKLIQEMQKGGGMMGGMRMRAGN